MTQNVGTKSAFMPIIKKLWLWINDCNKISIMCECVTILLLVQDE